MVSSDPVWHLSPTLAIDRRQHLVRRAGTTRYLPEHTWRLLEFLMQHPNELVSLELLMAIAWPGEPGHTRAELYRYIHAIREAIEPDPHHPQWLITRRNVGYELIVPDDTPHTR